MKDNKLINHLISAPNQTFLVREKGTDDRLAYTEGTDDLSSLARPVNLMFSDFSVDTCLFNNKVIHLLSIPFVLYHGAWTEGIC